MRTILAAAMVAALGLAAATALADETGKKPGKGGHDPATSGEKQGKDWSDHTGKLKFLVGWEKGKAEADFTGKPVLYFYTTTWCGWCKKLAGESYTDAETMKLLEENFVLCIVDGDEDKEFGREYQASGYPNTVFTDARGKKIGQVGGYKPKDQFLDEIRGALKKNGPVRLKKAAKELREAAADLAKAREKSDWRSAMKAVEAIEKVNREGAELDAAKAARAEAGKQSAELLEKARALLASDAASVEARTLLNRLKSDFEKLPAAADARKLLAEMAAAEKK